MWRHPRGLEGKKAKKDWGEIKKYTSSLPMVPVLSSAASTPFPGVDSFCAVAMSSAVCSPVKQLIGGDNAAWWWKGRGFVRACDENEGRYSFISSSPWLDNEGFFSTLFLFFPKNRDEKAQI